MKYLWTSRRTFIAALAILSLMAFGMVKGVDISMALASIAIAVAGSNAAEKYGKKGD
jgi:hypothetical protein